MERFATYASIQNKQQRCCLLRQSLTGWKELASLKVTVALDNPTPLHFDDLNFGLTALTTWTLNGARKGLSGGSHVMVDQEFEKALIVLDSEKDSLTILGDYRRILHCNAASTEGARRLIMTSYCSHAIVKLFAASH